MPTSRESREQYENLWSTQWANLHAGGPLARTRYRLALKYLALRSASAGRLLDVGAGNGAFMALSLSRSPNLEVFGAEFSHNAIELAPPQLRQQIARCDLQGSEPLPWGGGFDLATCMEVLEHLPDDARALTHIAQALRSGGRLLISVPAWQAKWGPEDVAAGHVRRYEPEQLRERVKEAGFEIERMSAWGGPFASGYLRTIRWVGPQKVMEIHPSGFAGIAAGFIYQVLKLDDWLSFGRGEQWFVVARKL